METGQDFHSRWRRRQKLTATGFFAVAYSRRSTTAARLHYPGLSMKTPWPRPARKFEGEHDFTSFAASSGSEDDDRDREMVREIYSSEIVREAGPPDEIAYVVRGQSFLRYMVRKIVGTLIEVGKGRLTPDDIPRLLEARDRSQSGPTVPPQGLYLVSLEYPDPTNSWATFKAQRAA